jgi:hypothetical protein
MHLGAHGAGALNKGALMSCKKAVSTLNLVHLPRQPLEHEQRFIGVLRLSKDDVTYNDGCVGHKKGRERTLSVALEERISLEGYDSLDVGNGALFGQGRLVDPDWPRQKRDPQ